jgi:hypothetical protein
VLFGIFRITENDRETVHARRKMTAGNEGRQGRINSAGKLAADLNVANEL